MPNLFDNTCDTLNFDTMTVEQLLLLIADDDSGYKPDVMEHLLALDFEALYPMLEQAVRNNSNADLRNGAMELLVRFGKPSVPRLVKLLHDPDEEVRNFATVMLGDIGNREAVGALIHALSDPDVNVSHGAAEALGKIGDRAALLPLIDLLKGDFWLQYAAINAISAMRDFRAVPHLLDLLDNELLAGPVVQTLGKIGDPRSIYPLCNILPYVDDAMAGQIAKALVAIFKHTAEALSYKNSLSEFSQPGQLQQLVNTKGISRLHAMIETGSDSDTIKAAVILLGWLGDTSALDCFYKLLDDPEYLVTVESAILSMGQEATASLIKALAHSNDTVIIVAIRSLRWLGEPGATSRLIGLINSPNPEIQIEALETLKSCPVKEILPDLYQLLLHDNHDISSRAAEALGRFPLSTLQPLLEKVLASADASARKQAAILIGNLQSGNGVDLLGSLAADHEPVVRCAALKVIGKRQLKTALHLIHQALADTESPVREAAVMALAEFGEPNFTEDLLMMLDNDNQQNIYAVVKALGAMGATETGIALVDYLDRENVPRNLEYAIIETLGKINFKPASAKIANKYLKCSDPDIRRLAVETLGKFGDQHSINKVEIAAQDAHWSVRVAALHVLGKIGGVKELPIILSAMEDKDYMVRKNAIIVLGNVRDLAAIPPLAHQLLDMEMSRFAFEALLKYGKMALPWLHRLMTKNFPTELRVRVIDLIGKIADSKSVKPLLDLLDETSPEIRLAAIDALSFCYNSMPLKRLASIQKNDDNEEVKKRATLALKTFMMEQYF